MYNPHRPIYFEGAYCINENGDVVTGPYNTAVSVEKIVIHHYFTKSLEEYLKKRERGFADKPGKYQDDKFNKFNRNEEFDDSILKYRDARAKVYQPPDNSRAEKRVFNSLVKNLSPVLAENTAQDFYENKIETFLTCRAVSSYFKEKFPNNSAGSFLEEVSVAAIAKLLEISQQMSLSNTKLLTRELPNLLKLPYPVVEELRNHK